MGIPTPVITPAPAAAITVEGTPVVAITTAAAPTTVAAEDITQGAFIQEVSSLGTRPESIIPNTDLPGLVLYLGTGFRGLTLTYPRPPQTIVNWRIA